MRIISHDPFGRTSLVRVTVKFHVSRDAMRACDWCGRVMARPILYRYGLEHDDKPGRIDWTRGTFCSVGCFRSHYLA